MFGWFGQKAHLKKLNDILANAPEHVRDMTPEQRHAFWTKVRIRESGSKTYTTWNGQISAKPTDHKPQKANWDPKAERRGMMYGVFKILESHGNKRAQDAEADAKFANEYWSNELGRRK